MMRLGCPTLGTVMLAVLLTACGSDADQVRDTVSGYFSAQANKDAAKSCGYLSDDLQRRFTQSEQATAQAALGAAVQVRTCTDAATYYFSTFTAVTAPTVGAITVNGDDATATVTATGISVTLSLHRFNGAWKITGLGGTGISCGSSAVATPLPASAAPGTPCPSLGPRPSPTP